jgi:sulfite exporter TauE/SafE
MTAIEGLMEAAHAENLLVVAGVAVATGLVSSLHCFAMCGPLACASCSGCSRTAERRRAAAAYHLARVAAYGLVGAVLGGLGGGAMQLLHLSSPGWLPWVMAALLVASALGLGERFPSIPGFSHLARVLARAGARLSPTVRSAALGAATPLLPCGLLFGLWAVAAVSGSLVAGLVIGAAFALGGVPALAAAQLQSAWMRRLPAGSELVLRRVVPMAAAGLLVYRALTMHAVGDCCHP